MKLIIKTHDIYDIGHDDSINEYVLYVTTNDGVFVEASVINDVYGEKLLDVAIKSIRTKYNITQEIRVPYNKTTEEVLNEVRN